MTKNYLKFKRRIRVVSTLVMCVWLVFIYKLFTIQIIDRVDNPQGMKVEMIKGKRGNIFDASGSNITQNLTFYNIGVHPKKIANKEIFLRLIIINIFRRRFIRNKTIFNYIKSQLLISINIYNSPKLFITRTIIRNPGTVRSRTTNVLC